MTTYTFELTIVTGSDEFWEEVERNPEQPNVQMLRDEIMDALEERGLDQTEGTGLKLKRMVVSP